MILCISFGAIYPRLVGTVAFNTIAVSCLFCVATFICGVAKNFCIFNMGYSTCYQWDSGQSLVCGLMVLCIFWRIFLAFSLVFSS